ncbi:MAG TPA: GFA family protein [Aliidongia sp.]|nr:GFA family protein [Aliidongia sp.]
MAKTATCACGRLTVQCISEPLLVSLCHCLACQKRTGSSFGIAAFFRRGDVTATGPARSFTRPSDSGHDVTFHFCPDCGSTLF